MAGWQPSHINPLNLHKILCLSNHSLKIGNFSNFIMLFISGNHFVLTPIFMIDMVTIWSRDPVLQRAYSKDQSLKSAHPVSETTALAGQF